MSSIRRNYRFKQQTLSMLQQALKIENEKRSRQGFEDLSETALIESMIEYSFSQKYNAKEIAQARENERLYFTNIIQKIIQTYFDRLEENIHSLHLQLQDTHEWLRIGMAADEVLGHFRENGNKKDELIAELGFDQDTKDDIMEAWKNGGSVNEADHDFFEPEDDRSDAEEIYDFDEEDFI